MIIDFDKILLEWSYRVSDGIIQTRNIAHQLHLRQILFEFGWPQKVIDGVLHNLNEQEKDREKILKTRIKYKDGDGNDRETSVKSAYENPEHPAHQQAKDLLDTGKTKEPTTTVKGPDAKADRGKPHNTDINPDYKRDGGEEPGEPKEKKPKGDHKSKQKHIESGFVKGAAPGNAGSMYNEIMSGEVADLLRDNPDASEEELVKSILDKYGDSKLAKDNSSVKMAGKLSTKELPEDLPKEQRELYSKTLIAVRSGKRKHQRSVDASKDLGWKNSETTEYFGDKVGLKKQEEDIKSASKVVDLDGNEIPKDEIVELIRAGGGGDNPSDTATIIKNKDTGEATILFTSDKDSTSAIIAQSSTKAESTQTDDAILSLADSGKITQEESEAVAGERRNYSDSLEEIETKLRSVTSEPAKYVNDNFESDDIDFMKSIGAGNQKYWDGEKGVIKKFKKNTNWSTDRFDENGQKIEGQKHNSGEYLKEVGWDGESEPTEEQQAKAFLLYSTKVENPPKNVQRVISDLNKHKGGPNVDNSIEDIRKESIDLLDKQIEELDQIDVDGVGLGTHIEGNNIWKQGHMGAISGEQGVHKYRGMFETNHAGVVLDGNVLKKALGVNSKEEFLKKLQVDKTEKQISKGDRVTGSTGIVYVMVGEERVPIMEKRNRTKDGPLGKLQTVYKWTNEFQQLIKDKQ
jgi:hypothetical protein